MVMLDANIILRYLLNDNEQMADEAEKIIEEKSGFITVEIIAEVVYVLRRVYSIERDAIKLSLFQFLSEVKSNETEVIKLGLTVYGEKNLDFIDCILYAYHKVRGYEIMTFDKKLKRLLQNEI
ncbi:MAG: PIN domain-containing protein [Butyrivibrio sp.]|nr:PIN domain-containing protein [Acetatifactor muris]MCM1558038.1 PIN domain-containing protein [Butyrivibrio sp.]